MKVILALVLIALMVAAAAVSLWVVMRSRRLQRDYRLGPAAQLSGLNRSYFAFFSAHNAFWACVVLLGGALLILIFGATPLTLALAAGGLVAGILAMGAALWPPRLQTLGLCWRRPCQAARGWEKALISSLSVSARQSQALREDLSSPDPLLPALTRILQGKGGRAARLVPDGWNWLLRDALRRAMSLMALTLIAALPAWILFSMIPDLHAPLRWNVEGQVAGPQAREGPGGEGQGPGTGPGQAEQPQPGQGEGGASGGEGPDPELDFEQPPVPIPEAGEPVVDLELPPLQAESQGEETPEAPEQRPDPARSIDAPGGARPDERRRGSSQRLPNWIRALLEKEKP